MNALHDLEQPSVANSFTASIVDGMLAPSATRTMPFFSKV